MPNPTTIDPYVRPFTKAQDILDCVCDELNAMAALDALLEGCPCYAFVSNGQSPDDHCCQPCQTGRFGGQLQVWVESVFPTKNFPAIDGGPHRCPAQFAARVVVDLARCAPSIDDSGRPPAVEQVEAAARQQSADAVSLLRGIICCFAEDCPRYSVEPIRFRGPLGGCSAAQMAVTFDITTCSCGD